MSENIHFYFVLFLHSYYKLCTRNAEGFQILFKNVQYRPLVHSTPPDLYTEDVFVKSLRKIKKHPRVSISTKRGGQIKQFSTGCSCLKVLDYTSD